MASCSNLRALRVLLMAYGFEVWDLGFVLLAFGLWDMRASG